MKLRGMSLESRGKKTKNRLHHVLFTIYSALLISSLIFTFHFSLFTFASAAEWGGVDESVVEKYAEEHGRSAKDPLINTDQGDLLLFVFLLAGAVGGFIGGYYWRELMERKTRETETREDETI